MMETDRLPWTTIGSTAMEKLRERIRSDGDSVRSTPAVTRVAFSVGS